MARWGASLCTDVPDNICFWVARLTHVGPRQGTTSRESSLCWGITRLKRCTCPAARTHAQAQTRTHFITVADLRRDLSRNFFTGGLSVSQVPVTGLSGLEADYSWNCLDIGNIQSLLACQVCAIVCRVWPGGGAVGGVRVCGEGGGGQTRAVG